jgi:hypothetical protein
MLPLVLTAIGYFALSRRWRFPLEQNRSSTLASPLPSGEVGDRRPKAFGFFHQDARRKRRAFESDPGEGLRSHLGLGPLTRRASAPTSPHWGEVKSGDAGSISSGTALSFESQSLLLWSSWFVIYLIVLSFLRGLMHLYYWLMLAPPLAALTGIGARQLWLAFDSDDKTWSARLFPLALLTTAIWQTYILYFSPTVGPRLIAALWLGIAVSAVAFLILRRFAQTQTSAGRGRARWSDISVAAGLLPLLIAPLFWSLTPLLAVNMRLPAADVALLTEAPRNRERGTESYKKLVAFLNQNHDNERYLVAAENARLVAPIIIATGAPALALGGFAGRDPILTAAAFVQLAAQHEFRYVMLSAPGGRRDLSADNAANAEIAKWVRAHGTAVDVGKWRLPDERERDRGNDRNARGNGNGRNWDRGLNNTELYDLGVPAGEDGEKGFVE